MNIKPNELNWQPHTLQVTQNQSDHTIPFLTGHEAWQWYQGETCWNCEPLRRGQRKPNRWLHRILNRLRRLWNVSDQTGRHTDRYQTEKSFTQRA